MPRETPIDQRFPNGMLIYSIHGRNQLATQEVRLWDRSIFNDIPAETSMGRYLKPLSRAALESARVFGIIAPLSGPTGPARYIGQETEPDYEYQVLVSARAGARTG